QQWARIRGSNQSEAGFDVGVWADDSFVIVGDTNSGTTGTDAWLLRYDRWGNSQWDKRLGGAGNQWGTGVLANADGTVTMVGRDYNNKTKSDILLARVGPWGYSDCQKAASCGKRSLAECDDNNPCTIDGCDTIDGCTNTPAKAGTSCAVGKICAGKVCTGG
ncbi:MAG: hypothetical protein KC502_17595, partial [Myxococcales bacterium]|nr:hypothetical protein [Myxococcales bacterium]